MNKIDKVLAKLKEERIRLKIIKSDVKREILQ
jgi:hypothetical protein